MSKKQNEIKRERMENQGNQRKKKCIKKEEMKGKILLKEKNKRSKTSNKKEQKTKAGKKEF